MKAENDHIVYHDTDILTAFREAPGTHIIVAADALMAGIDLPNVQDIIALHLKLLMSYFRGLGRARKTVGCSFKRHSLRRPRRQ